MPDVDPISGAQDLDQLAAVAKTFAQSSLTTYGELTLDAWKVLAGEQQLDQEKAMQNVTRFWGTVARDALFSGALLQRFLELSGAAPATGTGTGTGADSGTGTGADTGAGGGSGGGSTGGGG